MEKSFRKKNQLVILLFIFSVLIFYPFYTKADQPIKLLVAPEIFELKVKRGEILEDEIKIYNESELPIPIEVTVTNFGAQEETGTITFYETPTSKEAKVEGEDDISYNPQKWIQIKNSNFILDSKETEKVQFEVNVPENAEPGGHYAVVLFEPKLPSFYFEEKAIKAIPKIGVLFLFSVEVEGLTSIAETLTVVEFSIPEEVHLRGLEDFVVNISGLFTEVQAKEKELFSIVETSHLPFTLSIKNNDIYHIKPEGSLQILRSNGQIVGESKIKKTTILPSRIRRFPVEFKPRLPEKLEKYLPAAVSDFISKNLLFGKYQAHLSLIEKNDIIEKNIEFWVFPWKVLLFTGFALVLTLFFLIKYKKRIKSAILILFKK
jgi:hypothetical protein